jgi:hypothetical protein
MALRNDGRRLFVHPAHEQIGISALTAGPAARVALVVDGDEQEWFWAAALLREILSGDRQLAVEQFPPGPDAEGGQPPAAGHEPPDCLVLLGRPDAALARRLRLESYCRQGGALVALGSASQALPEWPAFAELVLGGWDAGPGDEQTCLEVEPSGAIWYHPLLEGVEPFVATADPRGPVWLASGAEILLWGYGGGLRKPLAWAWRPRAGRVFYSLLGAADDFQEPSFLRLLANAVRWAAAVNPL